MRGHRQRNKNRSAYFFAEPGLGFDFFFEAGSFSLAAGFGVSCEPFGLVFFGTMFSC